MLKSLILTIFLIIIISGCSTNVETCENEVVYTNWSNCNVGIQARIKREFDCNNYSLIFEGIEKRDCVMPCMGNQPGKTRFDPG